MFAVNGKIIRVDLTHGKVEVKEYGEELAKKYFGGSGLAAYIFTSEFNNRVDPLSPENPLFIMPGLLTGTPVLTAVRTSVCARSPLTGVWGEANVGGYWGTELKRAGYDGAIFIGKSPTPVYLWVNDEKIELRDASSFWGKNSFEADELLRRATDPKAKVMTIGLSGERMARLASIMTEGTSARAAGRTGLGAVMGAKQLKGVVVKGSKRISLAREKELIESLKQIVPPAIKWRAHAKALGTNNDIPGDLRRGDLPIRNWQLGVGGWSEKAIKITGKTAVEKYLDSHYGCNRCPLRCGKEYKLAKGPYAGIVNKGPEYETVAGFGSNLDIDDMEAIIVANSICNDYGVDTIGASGVIAVVMEAFERGVLKANDLDGIEARWGDSDCMLKLLMKLVTLEGVGRILAHGTNALRQWIGDIAEEFILDVKGLNIPEHDPRASIASALSYATSNRGACHLEGMVHSVEYGNNTLKDYGYEMVDASSFEGKGKMTAICQNYMATFNALGLCKFSFAGRVSPSIMTRWTNYVMGWNLTEHELMKVGERVYNIKRLFNNRLGVSRKDDAIPPRIATLARKEGGAAGQLPFLNKMLPEYYEIRGWDEFGIPAPEKIKELGLEHLMSCRDEAFKKKK